MNKSANRNQHAMRITSGNKPAHNEPMRLNTSPVDHMRRKRGDIPSTVLRRHCSTSCGTMSIIQHAKEIEPNTEDSCSRIGEGSAAVAAAAAVSDVGIALMSSASFGRSVGVNMAAVMFSKLQENVLMIQGTDLANRISDVANRRPPISFNNSG